MANKAKQPAMKRFGARYGRLLKERFGKVEAEQRKKHVCPYCRKTAVKRMSVGIWHCRKCDAKFTSRAYTVGKASKEATKEEVSHG